jgi:hypothetical protein
MNDQNETHWGSQYFFLDATDNRYDGSTIKAVLVTVYTAYINIVNRAIDRNKLAKKFLNNVQYYM